jgi:uncharacterized protein YdaT
MSDLHVVPHDDGWAVRREGAERVSSIHDTQGKAIDQAKTTATREHVEVVIHRRNGEIRDSDSYGRDPNRPKDRKH